MLEGCLREHHTIEQVLRKPLVNQSKHQKTRKTDHKLQQQMTTGHNYKLLSHIHHIRGPHSFGGIS